MMRGKTTTWMTALGLALLVAAPGLATEGDWVIRVGTPWVDSGLDFREVEEGTTIQALGQTGYGLGLALERRYSDRLGLEFALTWSRVDMDLRISDPLLGAFVATDQSTPLMFLAGPDIHLTPNSKADLYIGPTVGYVVYNDLSFELLGETLGVAVENDFTWGGVVGLDVPVGEQGWYFCSSVRYLDADADVTPADDPSQTESLSMDPLMVAVGFGYRF